LIIGSFDTSRYIFDMSKVVSVERSEKIPINYLSFKSKQYLPLLQRRISNVLKKGEFFFGGEVAEFEQQLKQLFKRPYVMSVASGHDALVLAIRALQLDPGAEVLLQANAYPTAFAVVEAGCRLRLVDCDENGQIDLEDVKRKITSKTKLIIPVHLYGSCCDMTKLMTLSADTGIPILEDCAQSFGSTWQGKLLGTFGKMSCFSFYPTKNLGTAGDGGAIITKDKQIGNYCREARQYGEKERYHSQFLSGHSRLTEIQAAVLNVYLPFFEQEMKKKKKTIEVVCRFVSEKQVLKSV
jgi:dTDP-4-amino-4,6-dideoxygalactose transaminase